MPRFTKAQKEKYIKQYEECMREKYGGILAEENNRLKSQLEQAKKIIQRFVWWHTGEDRGSQNSSEIVKQAEQFIKENDNG